MPMSSRDGNADTIVRLYHRRRGWAWVGFGSLIGLIVYLAVGAALFDNLTGAAETASIIPLSILLVLAVAGLLAAMPIRCGCGVSARRRVTPLGAASRTTRCTLTRTGSRRGISAAGYGPFSCSS
jgi:hypothetical protein